MGDVDFAAAFMRFRGEDPREIPDALKEQAARFHIKVCRAETPCYMRPEGSLCECIRKMKLWLLFWHKVRLDTEGVTFPTNLMDTAGIGGVTPVVGPFHQPVFTHVCPSCKKREPSFAYALGYPRRNPLGPDDWIRMTVYRKPIDVAKIGGTEIREVSVCSEMCASNMRALYPEEWNLGLLGGAKTLDEFEGPALDRVAAGFDEVRRRHESDGDLRTRLRKESLPRLREEVRKRDARPKMYKLKTLSGKDLDGLARDLVGAERWHGETDAQFRHRVKEWLGTTKKRFA